jgi:hypothetical protein
VADAGDARPGSRGVGDGVLVVGGEEGEVAWGLLSVHSGWL